MSSFSQVSNNYVNGSNHNWKSIAVSADKRLMLVGGEGIMAKSTDQGADFAQVNQLKDSTYGGTFSSFGAAEFGTRIWSSLSISDNKSVVGQLSFESNSSAAVWHHVIYSKSSSAGGAWYKITPTDLSQSGFRDDQPWTVARQKGGYATVAAQRGGDIYFSFGLTNYDAPAWEPPISASGNWSAIAISNNDTNNDFKIFATTEDGEFFVYTYNSTTQSFSLNTVENGANSIPFTSIDITNDGANAILVSGGNSGKIYTYAYGAQNNISEVTAVQNNPWSSVSMSSDGTQIVAASYDTTTNSGYIYTSSDGGNTWTQDKQGKWSTISISDGANDGTLAAAAETGGKVHVASSWDLTSPTMTITASEVSTGDTSNDATLSLTFTSSEATTDFGVGDITIIGGSLSAFTAVNSTEYTATFTPLGDATYFIGVAAGQFTDAAGNTNAALPMFMWTYDSTAPSATGAHINDFTNNKTNSTTPTFSGAGPAKTTVKIYNHADSTLLASTGSVTVGSSENWNSYTLSNALTNGSSYTVYATFTDAAGNESLPTPTMTFTVDTTLPTIATTGNTVLTFTRGKQFYTQIYVNAGVTLNFEVEFSEQVYWNNASNVSLDFNIGTDTATATALSNSTDADNKVVFRYAIQNGDNGTVSLLDNRVLAVANGDPIRDGAGNQMNNFTLNALQIPYTGIITELIADTTAPTVSFTVGYLKIGDKSTVTATISKALYEGRMGLPITNNSNATDFTVTSSSGSTIGTINVVSTTSITFEYTPKSKADTLTFSASTLITDIATNPLTPGTLSLTPNACFPAGTPIQTDQGIVPIEQINILKNTIRGYKIKALIHSYLTDKNMVLFKKGSLYNNVPSKDTVMSRYHKVYYNKRMGYAKDFVKMGIAQYKNYPKYTPIFNLLLESHENMIINNMIVETQNPRSTVGRFYNDFLLNKEVKIKDIHYAQELLYMFHETPWGEELMNTNLCHLDQFKNVSANFMVKEWFKAYLIQNKNKNKKRVINTMNKLLPINK